MNDIFIERYIPIIDEIINKYEYDSNISHLLYLIIPAFIIKYSIYKENLILDVFKNTRIIIGKDNNTKTEAFYTSIPKYEGDNIITDRFIVINNYDNISLVQLLDDLVHEFNHAINSYNNELLIKDNILYIRTGLTNISYELPSLKQIKKDNSYLLEEILNTRETEDIIDIIKAFKDTDNEKLSNTIYSLNGETDNNYKSNAYSSLSLLLEPIIDNGNFTSTLNNLRIDGNVEDIESWFDNITGINNSYNKLNNNLIELIDLNNKLNNKKLFKSITVGKMRDLIKDIRYTISKFNNNKY